MQELAPIVLEGIISRNDAPGIPGISTGLRGLDRVTAGKMGGDFWLIAGRPGMGKTALMCNMLLSDAKQNKKGIMFSLEMNKQLLVERMLSITTGIPLYPNIRMGDLNEVELGTIKESLNLFQTYPLYLDTNFIASLEYLETMIRKYKHLKDIDIVYVDYIQLLAERESDQTHAIGRISRKCKLLAEELDITVVAASQLNRTLEGRQNKRPILPDLRQSGNLEEDGDIIVGLYRDKKYNLKTPDPNLMEAIVLKQRNGPTKTVYLDFKEETNKVKDKEGLNDDEQTKEEGEQVGKTARASAKQRVGEFF
jgi:replicative DNA helicase